MVSKMPFRERIKKTFRRMSNTNSSGSTDTKVYDPSDRSCSLYYQPGEKIPYKYRRPVEPAHKAKLDGFSFGSAWRRKSTQSQYSPMGSRLPSRQNSEAHPHGFDGVRVSMGTLDGEGDDRSPDPSRSGSSASGASARMNGIHKALFDPHVLEPIMSVQTRSPHAPSPDDEEVDPLEKTEKSLEAKSHGHGTGLDAKELEMRLNQASIQQNPSPKAS
jgi:hypothetical protein